MRNLNRSAKGHVYFDLVDPGRDGDPTRPMLSVTLFDRERQMVNRHLTEQGGAVRMGDGIRVRIRGRLSVYAARSTLQLRMSWIDPAYTLGVMGQERDRVLALLAAEGLLGANGAAPMPEVPLHVALVTSINSAAHADALDELRRAGLGFRVTVIDARTQGADAERSIIAALRRGSGPRRRGGAARPRRRSPHRSGGVRHRGGRQGDRRVVAPDRHRHRPRDRQDRGRRGRPQRPQDPDRRRGRGRRRRAPLRPATSRSPQPSCRPPRGDAWCGRGTPWTRPLGAPVDPRPTT